MTVRAQGAGTRGGAGRARGDKRDQILDAATDQFGRDGFEDTKWADIAAAVGVGSTALYHHFESKRHCLYVIMERSLAGFHERFVAVTDRQGDFAELLVDALYDSYDLSDREVQSNRLLAAEQGLLTVHRGSPREEDARQAARTRTRDLEFAWAAFLARGMQEGALEKLDPRMLGNAVLGLHNSVWHWYRPGGARSLTEISDFYVQRILAMLGLPVTLAVRRPLPDLPPRPGR